MIGKVLQHIAAGEADVLCEPIVFVFMRAVHVLLVQRERESERASFARISCVDLKHGTMERPP
jgi:hypothetical protein